MTGAENRSLIEREASLPGLRCLLEPGSLAGLLPTTGAWAGLAGLEVDYLRYKPRTSCLARFSALRDGVRVHGYAKAFSTSTRSKIDKALEKSGHADRDSSSVAVLQDMALVVRLFPEDARLRSLGRLSSADGRQRLLKRLFKDQPGWESAQLDILNYKPERRCVFGAALGDGRRAAVKLYAARDFEIVRDSDKVLSLPAEICRPARIGGSKAHRAMAFAWLPGRTLRDVPPAERPELARAAGDLLARLHAGARLSGNVASTMPRGSDLLRLARDLCWLLPDQAAETERVAQRLAAWLGATGSFGAVLHGDFYDKQIIEHSGRLAFIDFDAAGLGDPMHDVGNFIAHLEWSAIQGAGGASGPVNALIEGYRKAGGTLATARLAAWTAVNLLRLAHQPFRDQRPDWADATLTIIERCRQWAGKDT